MKKRGSGKSGDMPRVRPPKMWTLTPSAPAWCVFSLPNPWPSAPGQRQVPVKRTGVLSGQSAIHWAHAQGQSLLPGDSNTPRAPAGFSGDSVFSCDAKIWVMKYRTQRQMLPGQIKRAELSPFLSWKETGRIIILDLSLGQGKFQRKQNLEMNHF